MVCSKWRVKSSYSWWFEAEKRRPEAPASVWPMMSLRFDSQDPHLGRSRAIVTQDTYQIRYVCDTCVKYKALILFVRHDDYPFPKILARAYIVQRLAHSLKPMRDIFSILDSTILH